MSLFSRNKVSPFSRSEGARTPMFTEFNAVRRLLIISRTCHDSVKFRTDERFAIGFTFGSLSFVLIKPRRINGEFCLLLQSLCDSRNPGPTWQV